MIIDKIVVQNFGVYKDRQELCLTPPSPAKPIILIGGLNGCGKTTLLDAFQLALYGKFAKCSNRRPSQSYNDFLKHCMNRSVTPADGTAVEIVFSLFVEGDEHEYHIKRSWHLANKSIIENFEVFLDGKLDEVLRDGWYDFLEEFLPVRLANLFFFDGEKIESLADLEKASGLLATAIHALLGVDLVEQLSKDLLILERRKIQTQMSIGDNKHINETVHSIQECQNNRVALKQEHADLTNTLEKLWKNHQELESKYKRKGGDLLAERKNIEQEKVNIENLLATANGKAREIATDVAPLIIVKDLLNDVLTQSLQEQKVQEADILGTALEKRDDSLLQMLTKCTAPEGLLEKVKSHLEDDRKKRAIQATTDTYLHLPTETIQKIKHLRNHSFSECMEQAQIIINQIKLTNNQLHNIDRKLASVPDEEIVEAIIDALNKNNILKNQYRQRQSVIEGEISRLVINEEQLEKRLARLLTEKADIETENKDIDRLVKHSQKARKTFDIFRLQLVAKHVERIAQIILASFDQLTRKNDLISAIRIDPESFALTLYGTDGKLLPSERLSAGERQLLATSMLWGLSQASGRPLPMVIDTPLGRLDSNHRSNLLERYFPYASHQVLLLSTDEEITAPYFQKIRNHIGHTYLLEHNDREHTTTVKKQYFWN